MIEETQSNPRSSIRSESETKAEDVREERYRYRKGTAKAVKAERPNDLTVKLD